jgi:hypothetical protein
MAATTTTRDLTAELAFLTRALKAPTLRQSVARLAERARAESWSHEEFLAACLQREVAACQATAARAASATPASRPASRWKSSTSTTPGASTATPSPTSARWTLWRPGRTWCSSARPALARPT